LHFFFTASSSQIKNLFLYLALPPIPTLLLFHPISFVGLLDLYRALMVSFASIEVVTQCTPRVPSEGSLAFLLFCRMDDFRRIFPRLTPGLLIARPGPAQMPCPFPLFPIITITQSLKNATDVEQNCIAGVWDRSNQSNSLLPLPSPSMAKTRPSLDSSSNSAFTQIPLGPISLSLFLSC